MPVLAHSVRNAEIRNEVVGLDVAVDHIGLTGIDERQDMGVFLEIVGPGQDRSQAFKGLCHDWILTR